MYQKKVEMFNRIIELVKIERDRLRLEMDREGLGLYLTPN